MGSTPKESTTKVEPWSGAKPYLLEQYKNFDEQIKAGAPKQYQGDTVAAQSNATKDALNQTEALARNGDTSALTNATNAVNSVMNQNGNTQANQTLSQLQNGVNLGTNPANAIAQGIANGTPSAGQSFTNPATAQAANQGNYTNSAIGSIQSMLGYSNPAMAGAQNLGNYQNAASGLQSSQANQLANGNNPAMDYLRNTASGQNIGNNPYLDRMVSNQQDQIANKLKNITNPGIDSQAAAMGRMGSGAYASQRNNAESAAANEMAKVATDMYGNQYNQDQQNQMNAANAYGSLYNSDVSNRLNANQALSQTDNAQQSQRIAGQQLYGNLADAQQSQRLNAANSLGSMNDSQQSQRLAGTQLYGDLSNSQQAARQNALNSDRDYQLQGMQQLGNNYQNNIANMLASNDQRLNAANAANSQQNALNGQKLNAASMAGQAYQNQYLPSQQLAGVGQARDDRAQDVLNANIAKWDYDQQLPMQNIGNFVSLLNSGNYQNTTTPVYNNTASQIFGGIGGLASLFLKCDVRTKILHSIVGYAPLTNGETVAMYEFSYIDDPEERRWVAPIAQEVEAKSDSATVVEIDGVKHINLEAFIEEAA